MGVFGVEFFAAAAEVGFARFEAALSVRVGNDASEQIERAFDLGMVGSQIVAQKALIQCNDRVANLLIRHVVAGDDGWFDR